MGTIISILIVIVCILLILVVLVQNAKGGGLASNFASSNQVMGVRKTADFLEKATWTLAVSLLVLSLLSTSFNKPVEGAATTGNGTESVSRKMSGDVPVTNEAPMAKPGEQPATKPETQPENK